MFLYSLLVYRTLHPTKPHFRCPLCNYRGPFYDVGTERHEHCPRCGANERIRLQFLVVQRLREQHELQSMKAMHFAPEIMLERHFRNVFRDYDTADLLNPAVDYQADLLELPFGDRSYDFVFASHVLEHIGDDRRAISEIRRILRPGGIALLPVPIVAARTIEYGKPNPSECGHVRAPGPDYFERYANCFSRVEVLTSDDFDEVYQLYNYEDRSVWPTKEMPLRQPMQGDRHLDYVPVCFV
jgi:SAM-dependent methyltransferase